MSHLSGPLLPGDSQGISLITPIPSIGHVDHVLLQRHSPHVLVWQGEVNPSSPSTCPRAQHSLALSLALKETALGSAGLCMPAPLALPFYFSRSPLSEPWCVTGRGTVPPPLVLIQSQWGCSCLTAPGGTTGRQWDRSLQAFGKDVGAQCEVRKCDLWPQTRKLSCECVRIRNVQPGPRGVWAFKAAQQAGRGV